VGAIFGAGTTTLEALPPPPPPPQATRIKDVSSVILHLICTNTKITQVLAFCNIKMYFLVISNISEALFKELEEKLASHTGILRPILCY